MKLLTLLHSNKTSKFNEKVTSGLPLFANIWSCGTFGNLVFILIRLTLRGHAASMVVPLLVPRNDHYLATVHSQPLQHLPSSSEVWSQCLTLSVIIVYFLMISIQAHYLMDHHRFVALLLPWNDAYGCIPNEYLM